MANKTSNKGKYSVSVIRKVIALLSAWIRFYMKWDPEKIKLTVSKGNGKIGHVLNVSLAPIITCCNCKLCKFFCYDIKAVLAYPSVLHARSRNTALFKLDRDLFFNKLWQVMKRRKKNFFLRFHVSGEIVDLDHFDRMINTALRFPHYIIWTYTKNYAVVNEWIKQHGGNKNALPANFSVMFSEWTGLPIDNPYGLPVFTCAFSEKDKEGKTVCPGNCEICLTTKSGCPYGESKYTLPH